MKRSKFSEEQVIAILREQEAGKRRWMCAGDTASRTPLSMPGRPSTAASSPLMPGGRAVFALSLDNGTHGAATLAPSYKICCQRYPERARFTAYETRAGWETGR